MKDQLTDWLPYSRHRWYRFTKSDDKKWDGTLTATIVKNHDNHYTGTVYQPRDPSFFDALSSRTVCVLYSDDFELLKLKINIKLNEIGFELNL